MELRSLSKNQWRLIGTGPEPQQSLDASATGERESVELCDTQTDVARDRPGLTHTPETMPLVCNNDMAPALEEVAPSFSVNWAVRFRKRHGLVFRVPTTKQSQQTAEGESKEEQRMLFQARAARIATTGSLSGIPPSRFVFADELHQSWVPRVRKTVSKRGEKDIPVAKEYSDDGGRAFTVLITVTGAGVGLKLYIVYKGTAPHIDYTSVSDRVAVGASTESSFMNNFLTMKYLEQVVIPPLEADYRDSATGELLHEPAPAVLVWDCFASHSSCVTLETINRKWPWLRILFVPTSTSSYLQVGDIAINKSYHDHFHELVRQRKLLGLLRGAVVCRCLVVLPHAP